MSSGEYKLTVFHEVYTPQSLSKIDERAKHDKGLQSLNWILKGDNDYPQINRTHLDKCFCFAKEKGGLDNDKISRLSNPNDFHGWLSVYNELLVPYFFAKVFKHKIEFVTNPAKKGLGDFHIIHPKGKVVVEVKTPKPKGDDAFSNGQKNAEYSGYGDEFIKSVLKEAFDQLRPGTRNLVIICPQLCRWIRIPKPFIWYLYGKEAMIDEEGRLRTAIVPNGELLKHRPPRFTRISAVGSFWIDSIQYPNRKGLPVSLTLFHNYYAKKQIPIDVFDSVEQYVINESANHIAPINSGNCRFLIHE
ncbi:MAG: hypothetical protein FVQ84_05895 [Planctomycetes bacterium]|nr:hypothetical protein [Planctomycetota bacterium]